MVDTLKFAQDQLGLMEYVSKRTQELFLEHKNQLEILNKKKIHIDKLKISLNALYIQIGGSEKKYDKFKLIQEKLDYYKEYEMLHTQKIKFFEGLIMLQKISIMYLKSNGHSLDDILEIKNNISDLEKDKESAVSLENFANKKVKYYYEKLVKITNKKIKYYEKLVKITKYIKDGVVYTDSSTSISLVPSSDSEDDYIYDYDKDHYTSNIHNNNIPTEEL